MYTKLVKNWQKITQRNCLKNCLFSLVGALCFEWGFKRTFPGNQDVAVK